MNKIKFIVNWLVYSSENAEEISMTIKSFGIAIIPAVLVILGAFNVNFSSEQLTSVVNDVSQVIISFGAIVSLYGATFGMLRKITSTINGTNAVVAKYSNKE